MQEVIDQATAAGFRLGPEALAKIGLHILREERRANENLEAMVARHTAQPEDPSSPMH